MIFQEAKCPKCSGELRVPTNLGVVKCMYCGSDIIVQKAISEISQPSINSLLQIAATAMSAENYREAYIYFTKILDINPEIEIAWIGRGLSAGFISKIEKLRSSEESIKKEIGPEFGEIDEEVKIKEEEASFCVKRALELNPMNDFANYAPIRINDYELILCERVPMWRWRIYRILNKEYAVKVDKEESEIRKNYENDKYYWTEAEVAICATAGKDKYDINNTVLSNATSMEGRDDLNFDNLFKEWVDCIKQQASKYKNYKDGLIIYLGKVKNSADKCNLKQSSFVKWYSSILEIEQNKDNIVSEIIKLCKEGHDDYLWRQIEPILLKLRIKRLDEYLKEFIQRLAQGT